MTVQCASSDWMQRGFCLCFLKWKNRYNSSTHTVTNMQEKIFSFCKERMNCMVTSVSEGSVLHQWAYSTSPSMVSPLSHSVHCPMVSRVSHDVPQCFMVSQCPLCPIVSHDVPECLVVTTRGTGFAGARRGLPTSPSFVPFMRRATSLQIHARRPWDSCR